MNQVYRLWKKNRSRNEYLVVWEQEDPGPGDFDIYGRRVQGFGTPMHPESIEIRRGGADQLAPAVAAIPTSPNQGRYLVVWEDHWVPGDIDIHGRRVDGEGNPQPDVDVKITFEDGEYTLKTDSEGVYRKDNLEQGMYTVTVDAPGYEDKEEEVEIK